MAGMPAGGVYSNIAVAAVKPGEPRERAFGTYREAVKPYESLDAGRNDE
jgi:hypothetical protein